MSVLLIMLPVALLLAALGVWGFIRAARGGQFDDLDTPPLRAVFDDEDAPRRPKP
jgi:cbb3-type cytochrome oxidase maturation protein